MLNNLQLQSNQSNLSQVKALSSASLHCLGTMANLQQQHTSSISSRTNTNRAAAEAALAARQTDNILQLQPLKPFRVKFQVKNAQCSRWPRCIECWNVFVCTCTCTRAHMHQFVVRLAALFVLNHLCYTAV